MGMIDALDFTLDCSKSGQKIKEKLGRFHQDRYCTSPVCGRVEIPGNALSEISSAFQKFERELSSLSKTTTIKF